MEILSMNIMRFDELKHCPECGSLWHQTPIPEEQQELFGGSKWFSRVILLSSWETDRGFAYQCPDCGTTWDRGTGAIMDFPKVDMGR